MNAEFAERILEAADKSLFGNATPFLRALMPDFIHALIANRLVRQRECLAVEG